MTRFSASALFPLAFVAGLLGCEGKAEPPDPCSSISFAKPVRFDTGQSPGPVAAADLDGDGRLDLTVANSGTLAGDLSVLRNLGSGTFESAKSIPLGGAWPHGVVAADLNGDGKTDIAVSGEGGYPNGEGPVGNGATVLLNDGSGTLASGVNYSTGDPAALLAAADLNGDGSPDLAVASTSGGISVLFNEGDGSFAPAVTAAMMSDAGFFWTHRAVVAADVDDDGAIDLVSTGFEADFVHNSARTVVSVMRNQGNGALSSPVTYDIRGEGVVAAADLDGDGDTDLVTTSFDVSGVNEGAVEVLLNRGDGTFEPAVPYEAGPSWYAVEAADLDADGSPDIVVTNESGVSVLHNEGDGTFAAAVSVDPLIGEITAADLDGDGRLDLAVTDSRDKGLLMFRNDCQP